jgi:hypothetical protein
LFRRPSLLIASIDTVAVRNGSRNARGRGGDGVGRHEMLAGRGRQRLLLRLRVGVRRGGAFCDQRRAVEVCLQVWPVPADAGIRHKNEAALTVGGLLDLLDDGVLIDTAPPSRFTVLGGRPRRRAHFARQRRRLVLDAGRGRPAVPGSCRGGGGRARLVAVVGRGAVRGGLAGARHGGLAGRRAPRACVWVARRPERRLMAWVVGVAGGVAGVSHAPWASLWPTSGAQQLAVTVLPVLSRDCTRCRGSSGCCSAGPSEGSVRSHRAGHVVI